MNHPKHFVALVVLGALALVACDGIGRPLVDAKKAEEKKVARALCVLAPECKDRRGRTLVEELPPLDLSPVDLIACGVTAETCVPELDELDIPRQQQCRAEWSPDADPVDGHVFDCSDISVQPDGRALRRLVIEGLELQRSQVTLVSEGPLVVELLDALIDDVTFTLDGPVTLRIVESRGLRNVRYISVPGARAHEQRLEMVSVDGSNLNIAAEAGPFPGSVQLVRASLRELHVVAAEFEASESSLQHCSVHGERVVMNNGHLGVAVLSFDEGELRGTIVDDVDITECGSLAVVTGEISYARIPACTDPLRVYGAAIEDSFVDGYVQGDRAEFEDVVFGLNAPTDLLAWDSHVFTSNFCEHTETVRLTASVFLICPSCSGDHRILACADTKSITQMKVSDCPDLENLDECDKKVPKRPLPP